MRRRRVSGRGATVALGCAAALLTACGSDGTQRPGTSAPPTSRPTLQAPTTAAPITTAPITTPAPTPTATASTPTSTTSSRPSVPPVSARAATAGLVDVRTLVPDAVIDLRYATADNFTHQRLYPTDARCLVHRSMGPGLVAAASELRRAGLVLVFWDCYRPHAVQVRMFRIVPDPEFVARPGPLSRSHETGRSVDVTAARRGTACAATLRVQGHCRLDMGTGFDDFSARAHAYARTDVSATAQVNRARLRTAFAAGGLTVYSGEWWHFDGPGADIGRPHLDVPVD